MKFTDKYINLIENLREVGLVVWDSITNEIADNLFNLIEDKTATPNTPILDQLNLIIPLKSIALFLAIFFWVIFLFLAFVTDNLQDAKNAVLIGGISAFFLQKKQTYTLFNIKSVAVDVSIKIFNKLNEKYSPVGVSCFIIPIPTSIVFLVQSQNIGNLLDIYLILMTAVITLFCISIIAKVTNKKINDFVGSENTENEYDTDAANRDNIKNKEKYNFVYASPYSSNELPDLNNESKLRVDVYRNRKMGLYNIYMHALIALAFIG